MGNYQLCLKGQTQLETFKQTVSTGAGSQALDLAAVMKMTESLSGEIDMKRLPTNIINLSMENAGAQRGFLILENEEDKKSHIEAEGKIDEGADVLKSVPLEGNDSLSESK